MATRTRGEAFEAWLRATGTADEIALFSKSYADGFVAVAGSKRVGLAHVITAVKLARDAGIDTTAMEKLGHLFVKFTDAGEPQIEGKPPEAVKPPAPEPEKIKPFEMLPLPPLEPKAAPAPVIAEPPVVAVADAPEVPVVAFRKSSQQPPLPKPEPPPPEGVAAPAPETPKPVRAATEKPAAAAVAIAPRKSNRGLVAGAALAAVVAGVVVWRVHDSSSSGGDAPDHLRRLAPLAIDAEFPDGWHLAPDSPARIGGLGALKTALASRGGTDADPESRAFLAALPLTDSLAAGADITDEALVKAAQSAERGTQSRLSSQGGTYQTGGCTVAAIAAHTAVCRGTVHDGSRTLALQTYVRVGDERAIVALFVSKLSVHDPASEADGIVASLGI